MAYDEGLAEILRSDLADLPGVAEKRMFGGLVFMLDGNMLCGVHPGGAMYRVGKSNHVAALAVPGVRPMDFTGRRMGGFVDAGEAAMGDDARRAELMALALDFVGALPPKYPLGHPEKPAKDGRTQPEHPMADQDLPQLYLVTPPSFDLDAFPDLLARTLDAVEVACVRLELATRDEDALGRGADAVREICHARDIAVVLADHQLIAAGHGLDGVHFSDGARHVRKARADLGADAIVGAFCAASRHEGLVAGENGADYVGFGPVGSAGLGDGTVAAPDLFQWWSEMIEVPVVAEGGLTETLVRQLAPVTDFLAVGEEIWSAADPIETLKALAAARG